jgi:NADPH-dependent 2,4-dienoyl-CoA reductase/sulfur reductase-like enzyme
MTAPGIDVLVVGGGPGGLTAASLAARKGFRVTLLDESDQLGGQYFRQPPDGLGASGHRPKGRALIQAVHSSGVRVLTGWSVWGADGGELLITPRSGGTSRRIGGRHLVLATGAHELLLPFPGWRLPGVVTPGFALHTTTEGVTVGRRVLLAGTGPFLLVVAQALLRAGTRVVGVAEHGRPTASAINLRRAVRHPRQLGQLGGLLTTLARHRVPWWTGTHLTGVTETTSGDLHVQMTRLSARRSRDRLAVYADVVCAAYGFRPNSELSQLLGCAHRFDLYSRSPLPVSDRYGRTSQPGVYCIGDAAGIGGAELAMSRAHLVVAAIAHAEGVAADDADVARHQRRVTRLESFAAFNRELFHPPFGSLSDLADDVVTCRCEGVTAGEIRQAARSGWSDVSGIKGSTRAGMGPCQGRECGAAVHALAAEAGAEPSPWRARMPLRPVGLLAASRIRPWDGGAPDGD